MVECPWCHEEVEVNNGRCPACKNDIDAEAIVHEFDPEREEFIFKANAHLSVEDRIAHSFQCAKCKCDECLIKEVAMTGTGLSKLFDIEHHHFLAVSCTHCGFAEFYNPDILKGKKSGQLGTIMDILFGG
ncbi:hypothetical protein GT003_11095 [Paenibacillus sacheonensis]|uniref:Nucleic acid-binding protein n=1 Tax=Paenibacillus sacheonensis TaxID=742054 RepID=A0A7X4YQ62_9BACL|nr:hypothetical protein [Paenibacillus sacheonensis]